jgi:hypothetical protein
MKPTAYFFSSILIASSLSLAACNDLEDPVASTPKPAATNDAGTNDAGTNDPLSLAAPATPDDGFQLAIPPFSVGSGEETQRCFFMEVPYDTEVFVHRLVVEQTAGSHHMNIFRVKTISNLSGKNGDVVVDGECWKSPNWADWPLVINSQESGEVDWTLPDGVAHQFEPHELLMVQSHYVNATTQMTPAQAEVKINFERLPQASVQNVLGTAFATNQHIDVCPGQVDPMVEASCMLGSSTPVTVVAANGHFHSRGKEFTMSLFDPQTGAAATPFYKNESWDNPLFDRSLSVVIPAGGGFDYQCEYEIPAGDCGDPSMMCCFTFGPKVETNEHCNAFVYYYPKGASDIRCF